jgi:Winged helix DNA-binding domain
MIAHPAVLTWDGVTARRMARHALAQPSAELDPAGVAGLLCGAHAQILTAAEFSIGRRIAGATRADVRRALWEDRTLVKTFGPRGTVHLLPAADLPMWTGALSALPPSAPAHPEGVRFTHGQAAEVIAAISDALDRLRKDRPRKDRLRRGCPRRGCPRRGCPRRGCPRRG